MTTLVELAARAADQPPPTGSGPYSYVHTTGRYLATDRTIGRRILDRRVEDTEREFWVAADGSGRIEETRDGRRSPMSGVYGPGGLWPGPLATAAAGAPAVAALRQNHSPLIEQIAALWHVQAISPALQADLLRALAGEPGLRLEEPARCAGRPGLAVSLDDRGPGGRTRRRLLLDPATGSVLAAEEITLRGGSPDRPLGPNSATCWVRTGYAPDPDTRP